jgi:hypothetical protein
MIYTDGEVKRILIRPPTAFSKVSSTQKTFGMAEPNATLIVRETCIKDGASNRLSPLQGLMGMLIPVNTGLGAALLHPMLIYCAPSGLVNTM